MSANKLKKAGTMQVAAEEGSEFLRRNWGEDKMKKFGHNVNDSKLDETPEAAPLLEVEEKPKKRATLSKNSTMIDTLKASESVLKNSNIQTDAKTRRQSERISKLLTESPPKKLSKHSTMVATAEESKHILEGMIIDVDAKTRNQSKEIKRLTTPKKSLKKNRTMTETAKVIHKKYRNIFQLLKYSSSCF